MKKDKTVTGVGVIDSANKLSWPGLESRFGLVIVAGLRAKQLLRGSTARIETNQKRRRHTSIALEEMRRGLVTVNFDGGLKE